MSDFDDIYRARMFERFGAAWPELDGTALDVRPDMDRAQWTDVDPRQVTHGRLERVGLLRDGTKEGRASVALLIRTDDGRVVVAETTWRLLHNAAQLLAASPLGTEEAQHG